MNALRVQFSSFPVEIFSFKNKKIKIGIGAAVQNFLVPLFKIISKN